MPLTFCTCRTHIFADGFICAPSLMRGGLDDVFNKSSAKLHSLFGDSWQTSSWRKARGSAAWRRFIRDSCLFGVVNVVLTDHSPPMAPIHCEIHLVMGLFFGYLCLTHSHCAVSLCEGNAPKVNIDKGYGFNVATGPESGVHSCALLRGAPCMPWEDPCPELYIYCCVCLCMYIYIYTYTCIYIYMYIYIITFHTR